MATIKNVLNKEALVFLEKLINTPSPTGFEYTGQKVWLDYVKPYLDDYQIDNYGTVYGVINPGSDYKVLIEAHADEISWFVHHITDGRLYLCHPQWRLRPPNRPVQKGEYSYAGRQDSQSGFRLAGGAFAQGQRQQYRSHHRSHLPGLWLYD